MNKEIKTLEDVDLAKEFKDLANDQDKKLEAEEKLRLTLWGLEVLIQEKRVYPDTPIGEVLEAVKERKAELQKSEAYAAQLKDANAKDKNSLELKGVAEEESAKSRRLSRYLFAAEFVLADMIRIKDPDVPLRDARISLKEDLEKMEESLDKVSQAS